MTKDDGNVGKQLNELIPATSYVPEKLYQEWQEAAEEQNQSISSFITTRVEAGRRQIQQSETKPSEIVELRKTIQELKADREELRRKLNNTEDIKYGVGMGKVKELIIDNPGIDKPSIVNFVAEEPVKVADDILQTLRRTKFSEEQGKWYPPEEMGGGG